MDPMYFVSFEVTQLLYIVLDPLLYSVKCKLFYMANRPTMYSFILDNPAKAQPTKHKCTVCIKHRHLSAVKYNFSV